MPFSSSPPPLPNKTTQGTTDGPVGTICKGKPNKPCQPLAGVDRSPHLQYGHQYTPVLEQGSTKKGIRQERRRPFAPEPAALVRTTSGCPVLPGHVASAAASPCRASRAAPVGASSRDKPECTNSSCCRLRSIRTTFGWLSRSSPRTLRHRGHCRCGPS